MCKNNCVELGEEVKDVNVILFISRNLRIDGKIISHCC